MRSSSCSGVWARLVLTLTLAGGSALIAAPATATPAAETPAAETPAAETPAAETPAADDSYPEDVELILAPSTPIVSDTAAEVEFSVLVKNRGEDPLPASSVSLEFLPDRVQTADGLAGGDQTARTRLAETKIDQVAAESEQQTTVSVARNRVPLPATGADGVYLVQATLRPTQENKTGGGSTSSAAPLISSTTPLVWRGPGDKTVPLSVIVPLTFPEGVTTLPSKRQLEEHIPKLDKLLTAATSRRALLAIDPRVIAGIRAYGTDAPEVATKFLARLETSTLQSFLLQFSDADPAAQSALGLTELLRPENFDFVTRSGVFPSPTRTTRGTGDSARSDSARNDSARSALPTVDELTAWPAESFQAGWPAEGAADQGTLTLLRNSGYNSVILNSDNVTLTGGPRAVVGESKAYITDAGLAAAARKELRGSTETARTAGAAELTARLALATQNQAPGIILALDRGAVADAAEAEQLLDNLGTLSWATPTEIVAQAEGTATLQETGLAESRQELLRSALSREPSVNEVGALLEQPQYLIGYQRARLLDLFATHYAQPETDFERVAAEYRKRDAELLSGVSVVSIAQTQLVGTSTQVPVQLRNALPFDAIVQMQADPSSPALSLTDRTFRDVAVPADSNERVLVPVRSRISSGESGLVLSVSANSGKLTAFTGTLPISIRSNVETFTLWGFGVLAALLLGFGAWRSVLRRRRSWEATEGHLE